VTDTSTHTHRESVAERERERERFCVRVCVAAEEGGGGFANTWLNVCVLFTSWKGTIDSMELTLQQDEGHHRP